ncbi:carboxylesterase family domain-containing protein [Ditylenchus destructor]|nr:carboxylesterase family domain-containing protein [Ditylenchus destructor]
MEKEGERKVRLCAHIRCLTPSQYVLVWPSGLRRQTQALLSTLCLLVYNFFLDKSSLISFTMDAPRPGASAGSGPARTDDTNFLKFGPRMDGVFFPRDIPELVSESPPKPTVMGFTPLESLSFTLLPNRNSSIAAYAIPWKEFNEYGEDNFHRFVRMIASEAHYGAKGALKVQSEIISYYLGGGGSQLSRNSTFYLRQYTQLLTDIQYIVPIIWESRIKAAFKWPVFLYLNTYFNEKMFPDAVKVRDNFHGNDHKYLFRCADPNLAHEFDTNDRAIEDFMVRWLVGFIKTGNPSTREISWPQATPEIPMRYLFIKENRPEVHDMLMFDKLKFWLTLVEKYTRYNIIRGSFHLEPPHDEL